MKMDSRATTVQSPRPILAPGEPTPCGMKANPHSGRERWIAAAASLAAALLVLNTTTHAQVTERVSVDSSGGQANGDCDMQSFPSPSVSSDGRFVVFFGTPNNLVPGDTNGTWDVFLRDRLTGVTERESVDSNGNQANLISGLYGFTISGDGRFVGFESAANNLAPGDTNGREVFLRDRQLLTTERIAIDSSGTQANGVSFYPSISADGRFVAFTSDATNLVAGDTNGHWDVFVRDRQNGTVELVSLSSSGAQGNGDSYKAVISPDARFVAFESFASNLVPGDTNGRWDVFLRDRQNGTTELVSVAATGTVGNDDSGGAWLSDDARYVGFTSHASNLVASDNNNTVDVFVRDRLLSTTELVSVSLSGSSGNHVSVGISLSADGRYAAFKSAATDLVPNTPLNQMAWVFVRDLQLGTTELVSRATDGTIPSTGFCQNACISGDGRFVAFESTMTTLVPGDTNSFVDVFVHDRYSAGFTSHCDPGLNGVIACPCGNAPAGTGRGCDNSSGTGGASLAAGGIAYLSQDSLQFTSAGEKPTATSILLEGDALAPTGFAFGQGVRCVNGALKRMYVKSAVAGSITAPDFPAGDLSISARLAQVGVTIQAGQPCFFLVYYRDPVVLGGCPASFTFNATQTGSVVFWP